MNSEQIEAARELIDFARTYVHDVFGDENDEQLDASSNIESILDAANALERYLDGS
jgi:hypothetical protein